MNKNLSTYDRMDKFKGILIILIVISHIKGLTSVEIDTVLLSFNVASFFFLPFLFNNDKLTFDNITKIFKRYFIPYTIFFFMTYFAYKIIFHASISPSDTLFFWITGTFYTIKEAVGIGAYWFFPALIAILVFIMAFNSLSDVWKKVFLTITLISHFVIGYYAYPDQILRHIPFNIYIPLYLFIIGYTIKYIFNNIELNEKILFGTTLLFFILVLVLYTNGEFFNLATPYFPTILTRPFNFILHDLIMISGFFSILWISKYIPYTSTFGKYSIAIYTLHPLVIQMVNLALKSETIQISILKFFIVLALTYMFTVILFKIKLNRIIYPK